MKSHFFIQQHSRISTKNRAQEQGTYVARMGSDAHDSYNLTDRIRSAVQEPYQIPNPTS